MRPDGEDPHVAAVHLPGAGAGQRIDEQQHVEQHAGRDQAAGGEADRIGHADQGGGAVEDAADHQNAEPGILGEICRNGDRHQ